MKVLMFFIVISMFLMVFGVFWGMNFKGMFEFDWKFGYVYVFILIVLLIVVIYFYL